MCAQWGPAHGGIHPDRVNDLLRRDDRSLARYTFYGLTDRSLARISPVPADGRNADTLLASPASGESISKAFSKGSIIADKYEIEHLLGQGGIGVVVVAKHLALNKRVAIKYLKPKALANESIVQRFVREARLTAQITSEHTVRVHDVGTLLDAGPYMVMEYLVGEDLGKVLQSGSLPIERAVDYILQACDALAEAHSLRIVHRDIKPENLFLAQRALHVPILKVIDFGISKMALAPDEDGQWARETAVGERFGTPLYMSPEQLRATAGVDHRTDIWSLGVVLHELLVGSPPFEGHDLPRLCASILTTPPVRISSIRPSVPSVLEAIVQRCLEKDPQRRFRNVAEFAQELAPFGPPSSDERVSRIREMVRHAGDSVGPPAAPFSGPRLQAPPAASIPAAPSDGRSVSTMHLGARFAAERRKAIFRGVLAASGLVALGVAGATLWGGTSAAPRVLSDRGAGVTEAVDAKATNPTVAPSTAAAPSDDPSPDTTAYAPASAHSATTASPSRATYPPRSTIPSSGGVRHIDRRRVEFGDRK
jgi:serine/threonine-protein kinase